MENIPRRCVASSGEVDVNATIHAPFEYPGWEETDLGVEFLDQSIDDRVYSARYFILVNFDKELLQSLWEN